MNSGKEGSSLTPGNKQIELIEWILFGKYNSSSLSQTSHQLPELIPIDKPGSEQY